MDLDSGFELWLFDFSQVILLYLFPWLSIKDNTHGDQTINREASIGPATRKQPYQYCQLLVRILWG
jgi:hypothetical protein